MTSNRPVEIVDTLHHSLPEVFEEYQLPGVWTDDWIQAPMPSPEAQFVKIESALWERYDPDSDRGGPAETDPWVPALAEKFPGSPVSVNVGASAVTRPPDAMAFYLPFHYHYRQGWGIYVSADGARWLGKHLYYLAGKAFNYHDALVAARVFLYGHEAYHHIVESFATRLETTHRCALYKEGFAKLYDSTIGTDDCIEEALASAYGVRKALAVLKKKQGWSKQQQAELKDAFHEYIVTNPPGYQKAMNYFPTKALRQKQLDFAEENHLAAVMAGKQVNSAVWEAFPHAFGPISNIHSRVNYIVLRSSHLAGWLERFTV